MRNSRRLGFTLEEIAILDKSATTSEEKTAYHRRGPGHKHQSYLYLLR